MQFFLLLIVVFPNQVCRTTAKDGFKGLNLYYNQRVPVNSAQNLVVGLASLGDILTTLELYTSDYFITSFSFPNEKSKKFQKSNNLPELFAKLKITNSPNQPPQIGYYVVIVATFVHLGSIEVTMIASDATTQDELFRKSYTIDAILESGRCFPKIRLDECTSPQKPRKLSINRKNIVDAIVERSCGSNSVMKYCWSIRNYLDTDTMYSFSQANSRTLRIPPFTLWFNDQGSVFHLMYVIKIKVEEYRADGTSKGIAMTRCYVVIVLQPPVANIEHGHFRKTNVRKKIILDASESRDLSSSKVGINLKYRWSCFTEELRNGFCTENMGEGKTLVVPAYKLTINKNYNFTVTVIAFRSSLEGSSWQVITPTNEDHLSVSYLCVRNCFNHIANGQGIIHMQGICKDCKKSSVSYNWSIIKPEPKKIGTGVRLIVKASQLTKRVTIELKVEQYGRSGILIFDLAIAEPPKAGSCIVNPKQGKEYVTDFSIKCIGFSSEFEPLTYSLHQDDQLLGSQTNGDFKLLLSQTETSGSAKLKLTITDAIYGYTTYEISIPLESLKIPATYDGISAFITKDRQGPSLQKSIDSGDITTVVAALRIAGENIEKLTNNEIKLRIVEEILKILETTDLTTTQGIETLSLGLHALLTAVSPNHKICFRTGHIFQIITKSLEKSSKLGEVFDIGIEGCTKMSQALVKTAEKMFDEIDQFPMVHDVQLPKPEDSYNENYPDYGELDFEIIEKINNWQQGAESIRCLFEALGTTAFQLIEPGEDELDFNTGLTSWKIHVFGPELLGDVDQGDIDGKVLVSTSIIHGLLNRTDLRTKVGLQTVFLTNNPFWWYPEQNKINSLVVQVNAFSKDRWDSNYRVTKIDHSFDLFLSLNDRAKNVSSYDTKGFVEAQLDMPIYQCIVPKNSYFTVEFTSTDQDIRVLTTTTDPPKYRQILENYNLITKSLKPFQIRLDNNEDKDTIGYIAILPHRNDSANKITFNFKSTIYSCNIWDPSASRWNSDHCRIGNRTNSTHIHCRCSHFSMFAAKLFKTPNSLELPRDIILTLRTNVPFLIMFLLILLIGCILLIWAWYKDKKNHSKSEILFVEKSDPEKTYMYLVTITTGSHQYAGTTGNIEIQLVGSKQTSGEYTLSPRQFYKVFERRSENTFALLTHDHLGDLESIILTNDYSGRYPSWYCDIVRIKDTTRREEYIFIARRWLSFVYNDTVKIIVPTASAHVLTNYKFLVYQHFSRNFAEMYLWYSLFAPHPRSPLNRKEKALVLLTGLCFGAMLSILFFGRTTLDNVEDERRKYMKFILALRNILHTVLCTIIGIFIAKTIVRFLNYSKMNSAGEYKLMYGK